MRISDWSSDVCSSDLAVRRVSGGVDRIVEVAFGANVGMAPKLLKTNGVIATYASDAVPKPEIPFYPLMYNNNVIRPIAIFAMPHAAQDAAFREDRKSTRLNSSH